MNIDELDKKAGYFKNNPITDPKQIDREKLRWHKMDESWLSAIRGNRQFWFTGFKIEQFHIPEKLLSHAKQILSLRDHLLKFGGEQACMPTTEPHIEKILSRGQFWYGDITKSERGEPSRCHSNIAKLWNNDKENIKIVIGYALSNDGMWRQHSWGIKINETQNTIIETTEPRIGYFGFVLSNDESEIFYENEV